MAKAAKTPHKKRFIDFLEKLDSELCGLGANKLISVENSKLNYLAQNKEKELFTDSFLADAVKSNTSIVNMVLIVQEEIQKLKY